jgi:hypothetical protein
MSKRKADSDVKQAVAEYLAGLTLEGSRKPLAAVAVLLAESLEASPEYARARIAKELRELLGMLDAVDAREAQMAERKAWQAYQNRRGTSRHNGREVAELEELANRRLRETGALGDGDG